MIPSAMCLLGLGLGYRPRVVRMSWQYPDSHLAFKPHYFFRQSSPSDYSSRRLPTQSTTFPLTSLKSLIFSGDLPQHPSASLPVQVIQCKPLQQGVSLAVKENGLQTRNIASGKSFSHGMGGKWVADLFGVHRALVYIKQHFFFSNGSLVSRHKSHTAGLNPALPVSLSPQSPRSTSQRLDPLITLTSQRDINEPATNPLSAQGRTLACRNPKGVTSWKLLGLVNDTREVLIYPSTEF